MIWRVPDKRASDIMMRVLVNLQNNALNHDSMLENKKFTLRSFFVSEA